MQEKKAMIRRPQESKNRSINRDQEQRRKELFGQGRRGERERAREEGGKGGDRWGEGMKEEVKVGWRDSTCILKQKQNIIRKSNVSMNVRFHLGTIDYLAIPNDDL